jgi:PAS domain S-box-containing protein
VPRRSPPFWTALAISAAALAAAVLLRAALLGVENATGLSATVFPALIVATLYAGPRWGWATLAAALGLGLASADTFPVGVPYWGIVAMFTLSAAVTVVVSSSLRAALLRLDEVNAAHEQARRAIADSEARFRILADSAPVLMWVTRTDGKREFANRAYVEFLGVSYDEAVGVDWRKVLHPDDFDRILEEQRAGEGSRELFSLRARYRRADGEYRWIRSVSQPRYAPDGSFAGFIGVGYDVTEAEQAEADLKRINELLGERVQAALAERDEAEEKLRRAQKLEAVGQLTGGVAHDFNNLLTVVIGALDLMQRHPDDAPRRSRMIEAALAAARRGERLTQQLLAFSRRQALKPEPVKVDALLKDSEALLHRAVGEAVKLVLAPGARDVVVNIDAGQFEAALMNLVVNARDATPAGGMIRVETVPVRLKAGEIEELDAGDYVCVAVHDTGAGMDEATLARAFEPFFTTKEHGKGTGLGLSQAYGFASQSGGAATVDSAPGKGASVCLYLPVVEAQASAERPEPPAQGRRGPMLRVLLVEDDLQVGDLVEAMLQDLGHAVRRAEDAAAALEILGGRAAVELLITDVVMPGDLSGVDLAQRAVALRPGLPVILSSGYTGHTLSDAEDAPWPLLRKPYGADQLAQVIADVTRAAA